MLTYTLWATECFIFLFTSNIQGNKDLKIIKTIVFPGKIKDLKMKGQHVKQDWNIVNQYKLYEIHTS